MKKIISFISIVLIVGGSLIQSSCSEDFLKREPPASLNDNYVANERGVEALLVGAYNLLRGGGVWGSAMGTDYVYGSGASDDTYKGTEFTDTPDYNRVEDYTTLPTTGFLQERWEICYNGVFRCNTTLKFLKLTQASETPIADARAKQIEAEAKYLRAWYHFALNRIFEKIPYVKTEEEMGGKTGDQIPNTDAGWADIEADLDAAIAGLPDTWTGGNVGRASKYAAMTLKAQAFMYQYKLDKAKPLLDAIIASGKFSLVDNFFDNYDEDTENNKESIFEIQCATTSTGTTSLRLTQAVFHQTGKINIGWGFHQPSLNLVEAYQVADDGLPVLDPDQRKPFKSDMGISSSAPYDPPTDPFDLRLDWTVSRRGIDFLGWGIAPGQGWIRQQDNGGPFMTKKFHHFARNRNNQNGSGNYNNRNYRYHRFAHVILWRAEVAVEDGDLDYARELVNQVRNRAKNSKPVMGKVLVNVLTPAISGDLPANQIDWTQPAANYKVEPYPAGHVAFSTKENAREAVRMEIRLEFATEGQRFFDLRRWGQYWPQVNGKPYDVWVLNKYIEHDSKFRNVMKGVIYNESRRYWPIPQRDIDLLPGVLTQNPNY